MSFNWWNKQAGALITGTRSYLTGKQGYLPNWQVKGKGLNEIFAPEQFKKGGEMQREFVTTRVGGWWEGFSGTGTKASGETKRPWGDQIKDATGYSDLENAMAKWYEDLDRAKTQAWDKIPDPSSIIPEGGLVQIPEIDMSGLGEGFKAGMDNFSTALAMGLAAMGAGVGGGIGGVIPDMPKMPTLITEEGGLSPLAMGGLALGAYVILKKVK